MIQKINEYLEKISILDNNEFFRKKIKEKLSKLLEKEIIKNTLYDFKIVCDKTNNYNTNENFKFINIDVIYQQKKLSIINLINFKVIINNKKIRRKKIKKINEIIERK